MAEKLRVTMYVVWPKYSIVGGTAEERQATGNRLNAVEHFITGSLNTEWERDTDADEVTYWCETEVEDAYVLVHNAFRKGIIDCYEIC